jgi:PAS domain S-box-containing protein
MILPQNSQKAITQTAFPIAATLADRSTRAPDLVAENQLLHTLARQPIDDPQSTLKTLVRMARDLCKADSVAIGFLETLPDGTSVWRWVAIAGALEFWEQTIGPSNLIPGDMAIHCGQPKLYARPELYFTYLYHPQFPIVEGMQFPLCANDRQLGTLWMLSHNEQRQFDREDERLITSLAGFAAAALQNIHLRQIASEALQREQAARLETAATRQALAESAQAELVLVEQKRLLELTASGQPLEECLWALCVSMSKLNPQVRACVLLTDARRQKFPRSIAPDLPPSFGQGLKDAPINELAIGTCGEAVYSNQPVTCADIAHDDRWSQEWRDLCVAHGVLACHSAPIQGADRLPLGSLMLCFDEARMPTDWEYRLADFGTQIASIVLERDRSSLALRESEAKYRTLTELSTHHVWMLDAAGELIFLNQTFLDYFGKPFHELNRENWAENVHHPDDRDRVVQEIAGAMAAGINIRSEHRLRRHDNQFRWFLNEATPLRDANGEITHWLGASVDIDDRKQAESALRRSEERYRTLFESIDEGFCVIEMLFDENDTPIDYRFLEINPIFEQQTGLRQAVGKTMRQLVPNIEDRWVKIYGKIVQTGKSLRFDNCAEAMNRWFDVYACRIGQPEERKVAILFKDISDRKRMEALREQAEVALRQSEEQSRNILESITDGFFALDRDWRFTYVNRQAEHLLDRTPDDLLGKIFWEEFPGVDGSEFESLHRRAMRDCVAGSVTEFYPDHDRWYEVHSYPATDGITVYFRNVTDRKRIEAEREQLLQREQAARETAENANRIKDEFLAVLSHELRSPLTPILGWSKLLQTGKLDASKTIGALATIERNAKLQAELIEDLLDVSRILQGKLSLNVSPVNLASTIQAAIETVRLAAEAKSIQVEVDIDRNVSNVSGDATRLQQVVWNLLSNAVKFTPNGGRVEIRLTQVDNQAQITIRDNGKGIASEFLPYVFDYFRQADSATTRKFGGLGLGLAIVRHLVELHGGTVASDSRGEGLGATFTVELPLMPIARAKDRAEQFSQVSLDLQGVQVLVVDDDTDIRELVVFLLEQAGASVTSVSSASEVMAALTHSQPDIFLCDIGMPDLDGYTLIQQVRALPPEKGGQIPAIALTAYAGDFNRKQAFAAGFQHHLAKPIEPNQLVNAIGTLLEQLPR